jgi:putative DNA-invertase from lambdoid prophage Rac
MHPALTEWETTKDGAGRRLPSTREQYARRLALLLCVALERAGMRRWAALSSPWRYGINVTDAPCGGALLARVSTTAQADNGESLRAQQRTLEGYTMMHNLKLDQVFVEHGVSGSKPLQVRREGKRLLAALLPGDLVITSKLDRMFRSARDALDVLDRLKKQNVSLHMIDLGGDVTGNGISKLAFTILRAWLRPSAIAPGSASRRSRTTSGGATAISAASSPSGRCEGWRAGAGAARAGRDPVRGKGVSLREIATTMRRDGFAVSHVGKIVKAAARGRRPEKAR